MRKAAWGIPAICECFSSLRSVFLSARCCCTQDSQHRCSPCCIWRKIGCGCRTTAEPPLCLVGPRRWPLTACISTSCLSLTSPTRFLSSDEAENAQERCWGHQMVHFFGPLYLFLCQIQDLINLKISSMINLFCDAYVFLKLWNVDKNLPCRERVPSDLTRSLRCLITADRGRCDLAFNAMDSRNKGNTGHDHI